MQQKVDSDPVTQRQLLIMSNNVLAVRKSCASKRERQSNGMRTHTHTRHIQTLASPFMPYCEKWDR